MGRSVILSSAPRALLKQVRWSFTGRIGGSGCAQRITPSSAPPIVPGTNLSWKIDSPHIRHWSHARNAKHRRPTPITRGHQHQPRRNFRGIRIDVDARAGKSPERADSTISPPERRRSLSPWDCTEFHRRPNRRATATVGPDEPSVNPSTKMPPLSQAGVDAHGLRRLLSRGASGSARYHPARCPPTLTKSAPPSHQPQ